MENNNNNNNLNEELDDHGNQDKEKKPRKMVCSKCHKEKNPDSCSMSQVTKSKRKKHECTEQERCIVWQECPISDLRKRAEYHKDFKTIYVKTRVMERNEKKKEVEQKREEEEQREYEEKRRML